MACNNYRRKDTEYGQAAYHNAQYKYLSTLCLPLHYWLFSQAHSSHEPPKPRSKNVRAIQEFLKLWHWLKFYDKRSRLAAVETGRLTTQQLHLLEKLVWARGINKLKPHPELIAELWDCKTLQTVAVCANIRRVLIRRVLSAGLMNETCYLFYLSAVILRYKACENPMHLSKICDLPLFAKPSPLLM